MGGNGGGGERGTCEDDGSWSDGGGNKCSWYNTESKCSAHGHYGANDACCLCGGGHAVYSTCKDLPGWKDNAGDACSWYSAGEHCGLHGHKYENEGHTANTACCVCGGGQGQCQDDTTWTDSHGDGCAWYNSAHRCGLARKYNKNGVDATQKCCRCK